MSLVNTYTFEEGTPSAAIPTGTGVTYSAGATYAESTFEGHGSVQAQITGGTGEIRYAIPGNQCTFSFYIDPVAFPTTSSSFIFAIKDGSSTDKIRFRRRNVNEDFSWANASNAVQGSFSSAYAATTPMRMDVQIDYNGSSTINGSVKIFVDPESATPTETLVLSGFSTSGSLTQISFGPRNATSTVNYDTIRFYDSLETPEPYNPSDEEPDPPDPGTVNHVWVGSPKSNGFVVTSKTSAATSVRLAVSTNSDMSSPSFVSAQTPDGLGYVRHVATGLSAGTQYYYQLEDTPDEGDPALIGSIGKAKTLPSTANFSVAVASCTLKGKNDGTAHGNIVSWNPDFMLHLGDFYYTASTSTSSGTYEALWSDMIATYPNHAELCRDVPMYYCVSDHEAGPDNGDSNNDWSAAMRTAYAQVVPHVGDAPTTLYTSWVVGRVRFIMIDVRNPDRTAGATTDSSSKTMLGATQKAWLKARLLEDEPLKIIVSDVAWQGPASTTNGEDKWWSYATERTEIATFINDNDLNVELWSGDSHAIAYTNPGDNDQGGFPILCASPLAQVGGGRNLGEFTYYYNNSSGEARQYLRVSFTDDGETITRTAVGYDAAASTTRFTNVQTYDTTATPPGMRFVEGGVNLLIKDNLGTTYTLVEG